MTAYLIVYWFGFWFTAGIAHEVDGTVFAKAWNVVLWPLYLPLALGAAMARNLK